MHIVVVTPPPVILAATTTTTRTTHVTVVIPELVCLLVEISNSQTFHLNKAVALARQSGHNRSRLISWCSSLFP